MSRRHRESEETRVLKSWASLGHVSKTLLIPLVARSNGAEIFPHLNPNDRYAEYFAGRLHANLQSFVGDWTTVLNILWRTWLIKDLGQQFFERHPNALGINLGAGLSYYFQWFDNQHNHWLDLDLDPVIQLRRVLFHTLPAHCKQQAFNITSPGWWDRLGLPKRESKKPVFLICEGVSMYLEPEQLRQILKEMGDHAPSGSELVMDFISDIGVGKAFLHPHLCDAGAEFKWGTHRIEKIGNEQPRFHLQSQHSIAEAYGATARWMEHFLSPWLGGPMYGLAHWRID
jgi:O-methyltransferase involved in polyketide biosynthesis